MNRLLLSSFLAQSGLGSRRVCEKIIIAGHIKVNHSVVKVLSTRVNPQNDDVTYNGKKLKIQEKRYLLVHKPRGYTCSSKDKHAAKLVFDLIKPKPKERLFTVGRLDKESEGLLLLTNDGQLAQLLTHPRYNIQKVYLVEVKGKVTVNGLRRLISGIVDNGEFLKAINAEIIDLRDLGGILKISVGEGRKREIRRMCQHLNYKVNRLIRTQIGPIKLGTFKPGYYHELRSTEMDELRQRILLRNSS